MKIHYNPKESPKKVRIPYLELLFCLTLFCSTVLLFAFLLANSLEKEEQFESTLLSKHQSLMEETNNDLR